MRKSPVRSAEDTVEKPASGLNTIRRVLPYLWPEGEAWVKRRVIAALLMLVAAKLVSVSTPYFYKQAVDALAGETPDTGTLLGLTAVGLTVDYGMARLGTVAFQELRDAIFVRVGQRALRRRQPDRPDCRPSSGPRLPTCRPAEPRPRSAYSHDQRRKVPNIGRNRRQPCSR